MVEQPVEIEPNPQEDLIRAQKEDPDLRVVRPWLEEGSQAPDLVDILRENEAVKVYWHQKDRLYLCEEVMYRKTPDGIEQLLVPKAMRENYMRLAHTGITGGHLGVRRTRAQVRRRAYWVGWSRDCLLYTSDAADERSSVDL